MGNKPGIAADSSCPTSRGSPPAGKMFSAEQNSSPFVVASPDLDLRLHDPFCALCLQLVLPSCPKGKEPAGVRLKPSPAPGPEAEQIPEIVFPAWFCRAGESLAWCPSCPAVPSVDGNLEKGRCAGSSWVCRDFLWFLRGGLGNQT